MVPYSLIRQIKAGQTPYPANAVRVLCVSHPIRYDLIAIAKS